MRGVKSMTGRMPRITSGSRNLQLTSLICICIALSTLFFLIAQRWEDHHIHNEFKHAAEKRVSLLEWTIANNLHELQKLRDFYAASHKVERGEFRSFVNSSLSHMPTIQALEWIPRVPETQRSVYEEAARKEGFPHFQISERMNQGEMIRAGRRDEYFPVYFVEPYVDTRLPWGSISLQIPSAWKH